MTNPTRQPERPDDRTPDEVECDRRLSRLFRSAEFPPTPAGLEAEVRRRLHSRTVRFRLAAAVAAVFAGAVGLGIWQFAGLGSVQPQPTPPTIVDKSTTPGVETPAAPPLEAREVAVLRSAVPVADLSDVQRSRDAFLSVIEEMTKSN
jgi:hypothetical protein